MKHFFHVAGYVVNNTTTRINVAFTDVAQEDIHSDFNLQATTPWNPICPRSQINKCKKERLISRTAVASIPETGDIHRISTVSKCPEMHIPQAKEMG